jgi:hypothetical protein
VSNIPENTHCEFSEIARRIELMFHTLQAISDPRVKRHLLREMRELIAEADHSLQQGMQVGPEG